MELKKSFYLLFFLITAGLPSCTKLVSVDPPKTEVTGANVYNGDGTAAAVLTGIYSTMSFYYLYSNGIPAVSFFAGLSSDEFALYSGANSTEFTAYYSNALNNQNTGGADFWANIYPTVYITNAAIEGLTASASLTPAVKQQLLGESYFMRAFCYFYLVNLYGDVPLAVTTDYKTNALLARASKELVWQQIISDLKMAKGLLSPDYLDASALTVTAERVRPTKWAAITLLARAYLYTADWKDAEAEATEVINNSSQYALEDLSNAFLKNNTEAIWQLQPVRAGFNTQDAVTFIIPSTGPNSSGNPVYLSDFLLGSFEAGDQRRTNWVDSVIVDGTTYYFPFKYKSATLNADITEYEVVLRLGELYLIRAEARAEQSENSLAADDLNSIRSRAGLNNTAASSQSDLLTAIQHERQVELFSEYGHRWFDLKRTSTVDAVMTAVTPVKGGSWSSNSQLYPIPASEILHNPNLVQNDGY